MMEPAESSARVSRTPGRWGVLAFVVLFIVSMVASPALAAQDATEEPETPDVMVPGTGDEEDENASPVATEEAETPEAEEEEPETAETEPVTADDTSPAFNATDPGHPSVISHGLAYLTGDQSVWQVREVEPDSANSATAETSNAALVFQVSGSSVIRNEVTGKRALLNPGESYFKAGGDPYTTFSNSNDSVIWIYEVVGPTDVQDDAFYESPLIDTYDEGVFDMMLVRYVLDPGESADLPEHTGPALVMSTNGDVDVESDGLGLLATGDGQLVTSEGRVLNNSQEPVEYVLALFGETVGDQTSGPGTGTTPSTTSEDGGEDETDEPASTDSSDTPDSEETSGETEEPAAEEETTDSPPATGGNQESINITAGVELYVVVVADGVTVFDGPIPAGGESGTIVGSTFEVYTSNGSETIFTNSCGEEFLMGYETGEARYTLSADGTSCLG
jgi:hypothetical protein